MNNELIFFVIFALFKFKFYDKPCQQTQGFEGTKRGRSLSLAEELGISETTYRRYERNESTPDLEILQKIANFYQMDIVELLSDDKYVFNQHNKKGDNNGLVINQFSEKLIQQYEERIRELKEINTDLKQTISELKNNKI